MIAAAVFLQAAFAGFAIAMSKLYSGQPKTIPPLQKWAYIVSTHLNCGWVVAQQFMFCDIVMLRRGLDAPGWVAVIMCLFMAGFALAVMLSVAIVDERHPPFYAFGLAIAWALLAIADGQRSMGLKWEPYITGALALVVAGAVVGLYTNHVGVMTRVRCTTHHNRIRRNATQCNAMQCSGMLCSAMQRNAVQCGAVQCNATQRCSEACGRLQL